MRISWTDLNLGAAFARACSIILHLLLWFVAFAGVNTSAEQTNSMAQAMSLADCIQTALEHNLNIKIERFNPSIARYNVSLAFAAYEPILSAGGTHTFNLSPGGIDAQNRPFNGTTTESDSFEAGLTGVLPTGLNYSLGGNLADAAGIGPNGSFENTGGAASIQLRQPLLKNFWIDSPRMTIQVNKKQLKISELALQQEIMVTVRDVQLAYYDLVLAKDSVKVQQEALRLAERLLAEDKRRVEVGALARLDEKQAESQVAARQADLLVAERALAAQENVLKLLLIDDTATWQTASPEPTENLSAVPEILDFRGSWQKAFDRRPDLLQARVDLERRGIVLKFLRNQLFPQVDVVGSYGHNASSREFSGAFDELRRGDSPFYSYGAMLTIPLGNGNARNNYKIGKAGEQQALLRLKQLELQIMAQVEDTLKLAKTNFRRVDATKEARLFAESALEAEQKKLETGRSTSFFVLQFQRDLTSARSAEAQALADYNKALAQLAFDEGTTLERNKLDLQMSK